MSKTKYIEVVFPLALPTLLTYKVPAEYCDKVVPGMRIEAELKNKMLAAVVFKVTTENKYNFEPKYFSSLLDDQPVTTQWQLELWQWIADYYCCTMGEVMDAALPSAMKLKSESIYVDIKNEMVDEGELTNEEFYLKQALANNNELTLKDIQVILNKKSVLPVVKGLIQKNLLQIKEELDVKFKPKLVKIIKLSQHIRTEESFNDALEQLKSEGQVMAMVSIFEKIMSNPSIDHLELTQLKDVTSQKIKALHKKGLIELGVKRISRLNVKNSNTTLPDMSAEQSEAYAKILMSFQKQKAVMLHGVTGSGKTRIYQELIQSQLKEGKQVLYLLPEITLSTQMVQRLIDVFGDKVIIYNSRINPSERIEVWNEALNNARVIVSARSGVFLPFTNLGLIIIDEEHDVSFKQDAPSPHYQARDVALYIASLIKCPIILGSATPSVESYYNVKSGKFDLVELKSRYGQAVLPKIEIIDLGYERKTGRFKDIISVPLRKKIEETIAAGKQVILFQNRRGYVPIIQCKSCGWNAHCDHCDVNLTFHKHTNELRCHYCNARKNVSVKCPQCQSKDLSEIGVGTEKIEQKIKEIFPSIKIARFDFDTTRTKAAQEKILTSFASGELQILVGTQMITKGFDFDDVQLVGIVNADALMGQPDFRANERAFQLMTQVAGRSGRREKKGTVLIQTYMPKHPVIEEVIQQQYLKFFNRESFERKEFNFPPFVRLIKIELKHRELETTVNAAKLFFNQLEAKIGNRVSQPVTPSVSRINNLFIRQLILKLERNSELVFQTKEEIREIKKSLMGTEGYKTLKIKIDVDPY